MKRLSVVRVYAYCRVDNISINKNICVDFISNAGYEIPVKRIIVEEVEVGISLKHRNKFINLVNYSMESGDILLVNGIDSLGGNFNEVFSSANLIFKKKIKLICLEFSKNEISGDLKKFFIHFLKLCADFEGKANISKKSVLNKAKKRVGRPEILSDKQKKEALENFKKGHSIYSIAKHYSVTRTVIQRLILKSSDVINSDDQ